MSAQLERIITGVTTPHNSPQRASQIRAHLRRYSGLNIAKIELDMWGDMPFVKWVWQMKERRRELEEERQYYLLRNRKQPR